MARPIAFSPRFAASGEMIAVDAAARERRGIACTNESTLPVGRLMLLRDRVRRGMYDTTHSREQLARRLLESALF
jgi:hypothetical protein